jgi:hypothetical protein
MEIRVRATLFLMQHRGLCVSAALNTTWQVRKPEIERQAFRNAVLSVLNLAIEMTQCEKRG